jgi:hypothetical protein
MPFSQARLFKNFKATQVSQAALFFSFYASSSGLYNEAKLRIK